MRYKNLKIEQRDDGMWSVSYILLPSKEWELLSVDSDKSVAKKRILDFLKSKDVTEKKQS